MPLVKFSPLVAVMVVALNATSGQDPSPRDIVDQAIKAHGGADALGKIRAIHYKAKGKFGLLGGISMTLETFFLFPDKFKNVIEAEVNNKNVSVVQVFDGKNFWMNAQGKPIPLNDEKFVNEVKENIYLERMGMLVPLTGKEVQLSDLGTVKIDGQDARGVRASVKGRRDINFHFDSKTFLLVKSEYRAFDPLAGKEVNTEKYFSDYKKSGGINRPRRMTLRQDGKEVMQLEITSFDMPETIDDSVFAKP
jgi:hypothetical protein